MRPFVLSASGVITSKSIRAGQLKQMRYMMLVDYGTFGSGGDCGKLESMSPL